MKTKSKSKTTLNGWPSFLVFSLIQLCFKDVKFWGHLKAAELLRKEECIYFKKSGCFRKYCLKGNPSSHTKSHSVWLLKPRKTWQNIKKDYYLQPLLPLFVCFSLRNTLTGRKKGEIWNLRECVSDECACTECVSFTGICLSLKPIQ